MGGKNKKGGFFILKNCYKPHIASLFGIAAHAALIRFTTPTMR